MGRDTVQLETAVSTISQEYLLEFTSEYGISKALLLELPGPEDRIVDFPEGKARPRVDVFQQEAWEKDPVMLHQALRLPKKLEQPLLLDGREGVPNYHMDLFNLIRAPNPTKVKTGSRPRAAHEIPLLTVTANQVIEMKDPAVATDSSGVHSIIERSLLDFANENPSQQSTRPEDQETAAPEVPPPENVTTMGGALEAGPTERVAATDPPANTRGGKSLAAIELGMGSTRPTPAPQGAPADVSDPDPLSFADPPSRPSTNVAQSSTGAAAARDQESENTSFASMVGSPESIYQPEWSITNSSMLDTPEACQDLVDYVAMGSQLRLRFEQEAKQLKKSVAQVARWDKRIQARENEIKNLETLLEAEADMKKAAEDKSAELSQELENIWALFSDLQVSNNRLSQQVSTLQEQVSGEEILKAAFEEFKQCEDSRVEQHCAEIDARLDALSIGFDKELYPHMLTAIAGHRWMIGRGLRLTVMKCGESIELRQAFEDVVSAWIAKGMSEGLKYRVEHGQAKLDLEAIEARAEKKKKCRVVCRTHGVDSAHHARSDGVPVFVPTVAPQGLAILLADAATQMETSDEASPQLLRSSSLHVIHG
uniref:Transposase (Putative), gypsy type n=1 Tax=Tanacetum cinerariifolium TaxID=118510 RepID=A0A6L2N7P7_TANCI|nr:hypothetical protein [Tanacetum cinerariifolium]